MKNAILFNMFRNGDLFVVREFTRTLVNQLTEYTWYYAHGNHPNSLIDMPYTYIPMPHFHEVCLSVGCTQHETSSMLPKYKPLVANEVIRYLSPDSPLYINTWAGCFHGNVFPHMTYPNMHDLLQIWQNIAYMIYQKTKKLVHFDNELTNYFPKINLDFYDKQIINYAIKKFDNYSHKWLIANGNSLSGQSQLDSLVLNDAIQHIASSNSNVAFICTKKFSSNLDNIYFTEDLFLKMFDLPEIGIFSSECDVIVGKNSGPFTYTHTYNNIMDNHKVFVSFSNLERDNLLYNINNKNCKFIYSNKIAYEDIIEIFSKILKEYNYV